MGTIKGQNLRVFVGGKCVAMSTSMSLHLASQTEDSSTKDDTNDFAVNEIVGLSWDASCDSLVTLVDNGSNGELPADLMTAWINKTLLTLVFDVTAGTNNRTGQNSTIKKTGTAYITDINITAANRANSTMTVQFTGSGAIA